MTESYIKMVEEIFSDVSAITEEKVEAFIAQTAEYLKDLQERLASGDEKVQKGAMDAAAAVQAGLGKQIEALLAMVGASASELAELADSSMSEEQKEMIEKAKKQFSFAEDKAEKSTPKSIFKRKSNKIRLVG
jgi:hypothetical protein